MLADCGVQSSDCVAVSGRSTYDPGLQHMLPLVLMAHDGQALSHGELVLQNSTIDQQAAETL